MISRRRLLAALPGLLAVSALARRHYNLKAAAGLGLTLPPSLLKQANRLIQ
jgi:hypothetical protein